MIKPLFSGTCTALVTPFLDGKINYPMLQILLHRQMEANIPAVVISGTTGESATLTDEEKLELIIRSKEYVKDNMKIIAGTGSNDTAHAIKLAVSAETAGADGLLIVSPYYNKSTENGLFAHYASIAANVNIPIILYNVPSRTGVDIPISVYRRLAQIPNIIGVKEASDSIRKILQIRAECPPDFYIWSGNDDMTVPILSLGGQGVISVASNVFPQEINTMTLAGLAGDFDTASQLQAELSPLIKLLFCEVNPIPAKAAMKFIGYDCGSCRLPLTDLTAENQQKLKTFFS